MKVLIVKLSAFGDIIHCLPALDDLLARPEVSQTHWLVDERYAFVTEIFPPQVCVHSVSMKGKQPLRALLKTVRKLRNIGFDAVFDLQGLIKSAVLARACGSPVYGFDRKFLREAASSLLICNARFHAGERHVVQQYRRIAATAFPDQQDSMIPYAPPHIRPDQSRRSGQQDLLTGLHLTKKSYVILHPASGWETKRLPDKVWISIAQDLIESGVQAVFSWGDAHEQQQAGRLAASSRALVLPERLNMSALCALASSARAVVAADTGLLHLAAALATPTISFWGPSASWRSAPLNGRFLSHVENLQGEKNWHIESNPACGPCFRRSCKHFICMDAISPESITGILHEL
jgi:heptosyltransferase-1